MYSYLFQNLVYNIYLCIFKYIQKQNILMSISRIAVSNKRICWCGCFIWPLVTHSQPAALDKAILGKHPKKLCTCCLKSEKYYQIQIYLYFERFFKLCQQWQNLSNQPGYCHNCFLLLNDFIVSIVSLHQNTHVIVMVATYISVFRATVPISIFQCMGSMY